jgi:hypothetical protein
MSDDNGHIGVLIMRMFTSVCSALILGIVCWLANKTTTNSDTIIGISGELPHIRELISNQSSRLNGFESIFATKTELENQRLRIELKQATFENEILKTIHLPPEQQPTTKR